MIAIEQTLQDVRDGAMEMMRPTRHFLRQLLDAGDRPLAEVAANRTITTIAPRLVVVDGVRYLDGPAEEELRHPPRPRRSWRCASRPATPRAGTSRVQLTMSATGQLDIYLGLRI